MRIEHKMGPYERFLKRPLDFFCALLALVLLSPVLLVTAVLIRVKLGSPVIFCQERPGWGEEIFKLYKFRSMTDARDGQGNLLPDEQRLPKFGRLLRATSLDELPELWNILRGDMSIVGPRPLLVEYLPYYTEEEQRRHHVRPGLTGLAQVSGRNFLGWDKRLAKDVEYVDHVSLGLDVKIIVDTFLQVLGCKNIAVETNRVEGNFAEERREKQRQTAGEAVWVRGE